MSADVLVVTDSRFDLHDHPGHPECAARLQAIRAWLDGAAASLGLVVASAQEVTDEDLLAVHLPAHVAAVAEMSRRGGGWFDTDTYCTPHSDEVARLAAGAAVQAVEAVASGRATHALAAVRPPGHHARPARAMGFCLFNNAAVAIRAGQRRWGVGRVALVDIDVHHGNGSQEVFWEDDTVLYCSLHQWPLYPGTGRAEEVGEGRGEGTTLNVPLPPGTDGPAWLDAFERWVAPAVAAFEPELVVVSAGYDAHRADPLASLELDEDTYAAVAARLVALATARGRSRTVWILEGGYDLEALTRSVAATLEVLRGSAEGGNR